MHGSGLTHIVWSLHEQFYASQGFNVLSVDLPGHGNSEGPALKSILVRYGNYNTIRFAGNKQFEWH